MITVKGLTKRYARNIAVDDISFNVEKGQIVGFLGPNGAGKTTTIAMLLALIRPTAGQAWVLGHDIQREPEQALAQVGAMVEAPAFYPYLSGRDNLRVLAQAGGLAQARVDTALAAVELSDRAGDKFRAYSQGMRQRLGIAAALLHEPQLIVLDEPTNGLDPAGQLEIRALIRSLAHSGHTIFLSSHVLHEVEQVCDEVAILKQGRLIAAGPVPTLLRRGRGVLIRVVSQPERAAELLRSLPWAGAVEPYDGALLVDTPIERAAELNMLLSAQGIPVAEIRAHEQKLEDFFLEVTQT